MEKSPQTLYSLFFLLGLISVNLMVSQVPLVSGATCFKVLTNIVCRDGKVETVCLPTCKKLCGPSAGAQCIDQVGFPGPICACSFTANNCQTQHVC